MKKILVVAPHPDDETLGMSGTLLKHLKNGDFLSWLIMTTVDKHSQYSETFRKAREAQIKAVASAYAMKSVYQFPFLAAQLDQYPLGNIIQEIQKVIADCRPTHIYLPYVHDVHSDHRITFESLMACTKIFRYPFIEELLMYETPSETDFVPSIKPAFQPNVFVDISEFFKEKINILKNYHSELGAHPFPRSVEMIEALGKLRGGQSQAHYAEAFMLLKSRR